MLGTLRPLELAVTDNAGQKVLQLVRPYRCKSVCCPFILPINCCFLQRMDVVLGQNGHVIGHIDQKYSLIRPYLFIYDENDQHILTVRGSFLTGCTCSDQVFQVTRADTGAPVGQLIKQWSGFFREAFTDADNFKIECTCHVACWSNRA